MKTEDLLKLSGFLLALCIFFCLIVCGVIVYKMALPEAKLIDALSILSSLFTIIGVVATVTALGVAYFAFQNQIRSNENQTKSTEYSISTSTANTIQANINGVRNALNLASYEKNDTHDKLEYGIRASTLFNKDFRIPRKEDMPNPAYQEDYDRLANYTARDFIAEILGQLEFITEIIADIRLRREYLKETDYKQIDSSLRTLVNYYMRRFDNVFQSIHSYTSSTQNLNIEEPDWRLSFIEFCVESVEKRNLLIEKLVRDKYLTEVYAFNGMSAMGMASERNQRPTRLQRRIHSLYSFRYYKSIQ